MLVFPARSQAGRYPVLVPGLVTHSERLAGEPAEKGESYIKAERCTPNDARSGRTAGGISIPLDGSHIEYSAGFIIDGEPVPVGTGIGE